MCQRDQVDISRKVSWLSVEAQNFRFLGTAVVLSLD